MSEPGRINGLWHIIEGALQAGRAGSRQVKDANVFFVDVTAPIVTGSTFIFVREAYRDPSPIQPLAGTAQTPAQLGYMAGASWL